MHMTSKTFMQGIISVCVASPLYAAPPFITDDPLPAEYGGFEINIFSNVNNTTPEDEEPYWNMLAVELEWGFYHNFDVNIVVPYASATTSMRSEKGLGDLEAGLKYQILHESDILPHLSISPTFDIPTGNAERNLGNGRIAIELPVWLQKSWGSWTVYTGGGWVFNHEPGDRSYPFGGFLVSYELDKKWEIGVELFGEAATVETGTSSLSLNAGGIYNINDGLSFVFSAGHSVWGQLRTLGFVGFCISIGD